MERSRVTVQNDDLNCLDDHVFRTTIRDWIERNYPPQIRNPPKRLHLRDNKLWYIALSKKGWLAPGWPREYGGMGLSASKQLIMMEELERHGCARLNDHGVTMLGPLLIRYGTPSQQARFLPKILSGEHIWCQGYSEPEAGSDLASLATEAVLHGEEWIVNGKKIWTTMANDANWIFVLVRTDKAAKKQAGISFLLIPMDTLGITVRPILNLEMHDEFCEILFDNVRVPRENLVGNVNEGWSMAKALLGFERIFLGSPRQASYALKKLEMLAGYVGLSDDPVFLDKYAQYALDLADHNALFETFVSRLKSGEALGADVSILKVNQSELFQRITNFMLEIAAENAALLNPIDGNQDLHPAGLLLQSVPSTIYGGSSEIQRNIVAKHVLDLPA
jgi:alkylation response protein AidB-like acyl-CoA dehydrogenase